MHLSLLKKLIFALLFSGLFFSYQINAQEPPVPVQCGAIIEGEISQPDVINQYSIDFSAGDTINLELIPVSPDIPTEIHVTDINGNLVGGWGVTTPRGVTPITLPISGTYLIKVFASLRQITAYTVYIGCTLKNGTVINPGDLVTPAPEPTQPFSGYGFPGLPPVDFTPAMKLALVPATPMTGAIINSEIFGFTLDAAANDQLDLAINRISGNLNLGVVVLSPENQVVFYGGLITSESLSTRLTLPSAGQYTIGVFSVDLLPPASPEATAFQVTGTLNP